MRPRLSTYIVSVPLHDGRVAYVHGYTGAMDIFSSKLHQRLRENVFEDIPEPVITRLKARGYVTDKSAQDERCYFSTVANLLHENAKTVARNAFWVIPTYLCNLRCYYCFQDHRLHAGGSGPGPSILQKDQLRNLFDAFETLGGPKSDLNGNGRYITLFGGEPLMDVTREVVEALVSSATTLGYRLGAVTNGVELHLFRDLLGNGGLRWLQVTIDGLSETHERARRSSTGQATFHRIIDNVTDALQRGVRVAIRTNADQKIMEHLEELNKFIASLGWSQFKKFSWSLSPLEAHASKAAAPHQTSPFQIIQSVRRLPSPHVNAPHQHGLDTTFSKVSRTGLSRIVQPSSCGAHTGMYFFDVAGLVYSCAEQVGRPELAIGSFGDGGLQLQQKLIVDWQNRHVGNIKGCDECGYALFCGGGCANAARLESGTMYYPRCFTMKETFDDGIAQFIHKLQAAPSDSGEVEWMASINSDDVVFAGLAPDDYIDRYLAGGEQGCAQL